MSEIEIFYPENSQQWRKWLQENHDKVQSVWVVFYKKSSAFPSLTWSEAVDEALCFGWIDSKKVSVDQERSHQFFSRRKARSTWSKINKEKILRLIDAGLMTQPGYESIETAKKNGSWTILDEVEALIVPDDLENEFKTNPDLRNGFSGLSKSVKKQLLYSLVQAKRPETRQKRLNEIVAFVIQRLKSKG